MGNTIKNKTIENVFELVRQTEYEFYSDHFNDHYMNPEFWRCLGKSLGWNKTFNLGEIVNTPHGEAKITMIEEDRIRVKFSEGGLNWFSPSSIFGLKESKKYVEYWHKLIDWLNEGKDINSFFEELLK